MTLLPVVRCCWDATTSVSNSAHIPPFAVGAGGDAAAPTGELEGVVGAIAEAELVAEVELEVVGSGADSEVAEVWFTNCMSVMSRPFKVSTFAVSRNPRFLNLVSRKVLAARP